LLIIIGFVVVFGSIVVGFTMHGGQLLVLWQISEFIIIGGAGLGALLVGNRPGVVRDLFVAVGALVKPNPYGKEQYQELLQVLYEIFYVARKDGLVGIEEHAENPERSDIFTRYPGFRENPKAVGFLTDTLKVLLTGTVDDHHLSEILELDLEQQHEEAMKVPRALQTVADAMPAFGIVAAVLGVIITMGKIGGSPEEVGRSVGAALVGTFLGVLMAYGIVGPMAQAVGERVHSEEAYMACIRTALLSFARGDPPITSVEFARRNIEPHDRPSFDELEEMTRRAASSARTGATASAGI
jgi:chemotaxis protein MotA